MNDDQHKDDTRARPSNFVEVVSEKQQRKLKTKRKSEESILFSFTTFGVVGWSICGPLLAGIAIGLFLDRASPASHSWTLTFMIAGLFIGIAIAWRWLAEQNRALNEKEDERLENDSND